MRRWVATWAVVVLVSAVLHADVTVTQTIAVEGGAAAMMGGTVAPVITTRIKGTKARVESSAMGTSMIMLVDLEGKRMIVLNPADKTARVVDLQAAGATAAAGAPTPDVDVSFKLTGQKRTLDNLSCDEYAINMTVAMASMFKGNAQVPPEAAQMLKDVTMIMTGSMWMAKGSPAVAEFAAFQKAAVAAGMGGTVAGAMGGSGNGLDKIIQASTSLQGLPYLTEMTMNFEGSGQIVDMMKQLGAMKVTNKVTALTTEGLSDDLFKLPADYTMIK